MTEKKEFLIEAWKDDTEFTFSVKSELEAIEKIKELAIQGFSDFGIYGSGFDIIEHDDKWGELSEILFN